MDHWRAWYADGEVYSSTDASWTDLPGEGMVGVVVYLEPPYRELLQVRDWWWMDEAGEIHGEAAHPEPGEWAPAPDVPEATLKRGAAMPDDEWARAQTEMMEAPWP